MIETPCKIFEFHSRQGHHIKIAITKADSRSISAGRQLSNIPDFTENVNALVNVRSLVGNLESSNFLERGLRTFSKSKPAEVESFKCESLVLCRQVTAN